MYNDKSFLAIIPARSGSKRLPGKNTRLLAGKPLIAYTIESATGSRHIDEIIVSTDEKSIEDVSMQFGARVPFIRPFEIATDKSSTADVVIHALDYLSEQENKRFDYFILLQPTSPLRSSKDIDTAISLLFEKEAYSIVSVCPAEHNPNWINTLPEDGSLKDFIKKNNNAEPLHNLLNYYRLNGAIYICRTDIFLEERQFITSNKSFAYIMPHERSVDIDNMIDFQFAEYLFSIFNKHE